MTTRARRLAAAAASLALLGLVGAACSAGESGVSSADSGGDPALAGTPPRATGSGSGGSSDQDAPAPAEPEEDAAFLSDAVDAESSRSVQASGADGGGTAQEPVQPGPEPGDARSLIKTGNVALRSPEVADTLFDVRKVLAKNGGEIAEENTQADDEGIAETALLTVRVPVESFDTALEDLRTIGVEEGVELIDSSSTTTDVSTQVIDVGVRVELQRRSIDRISILLDRATSIRDIVGIERELARREADLGSLQKRQAFLADQSSMSTITVSVERPREVPDPEPEADDEEDETGFVAGLRSGWDAFESVTTGLLTGAGALLPFAVVVLLVGIPVRLWLRRRQAAPRATPPEAPAGA